MIRPELQKKINRAIRLLQSIPFEKDEPVEVSYSGGKDSDVILQLVKESGIKYRAIYKNTTIDPPGTVAHAREMGAEVIMPKESFFEIVAKRGYPSRYVRFCCAAEFIADRGIKCHSLYYDESGNFHVERRLGCMGCPLASRKLRIEEFKKHPNLVKAWVRAAQRYIVSHPNSKSPQLHKDGYGLFVGTVFYDKKEDFLRARDGFGGIDCKAALEDYFGIKFNEATMP